ncbi:MAG: hypothetical protein M3Q07_16180 [Pseudobdellovibrionaceae bacterium]|nr:hypothetical protein [Pseudobdellovibrionaceae bacterium]
MGRVLKPEHMNGGFFGIGRFTKSLPSRILPPAISKVFQSVLLELQVILSTDRFDQLPVITM